MPTYTKKILSASTDGKAVLVAATASAGTTIHTGSTNPAVIEEVWLYASNPDTATRMLTIQWGGTTSPNDHIVLYLQPQSGLIVVAPGLLLKGNATPLVIRAFSDSVNKITVTGYINEIA